MDAHPAIEDNHMALKRILAALVAMAGLAGGAETITRRLRIAVLRLLRPAEAATRRLIIVLAREVEVVLPPPRPGKPQMPVLPNGVGTGITAPVRIPFQTINPFFAMAAKATTAPKAKTSAPLAFQLLDPRYDPLRKPRRRRATGFPRITGFGRDDPDRDAIPPPPSPHDLLDVTRLGQRLAALGAALDDLPAQARRFARWQALNERRPGRDDAKARVRPRGPFRRYSVLRLGLPMALRGPAARRRNPHEVYEVLRDTDELARYPLEYPDTS